MLLVSRHLLLNAQMLDGSVKRFPGTARDTNEAVGNGREARANWARLAASQIPNCPDQVLPYATRCGVVQAQARDHSRSLQGTITTLDGDGSKSIKFEKDRDFGLDRLRSAPSFPHNYANANKHH